jgi:hypothetical protein
MDQVVNNRVGVWLGGAYYLYLLHFRPGTIPTSARGTCEPVVPGVRCVDVGASLPAGTYLGRVGNSGVTYEPHLHVTLYFYDAADGPARSWSVPSEFADVWTAQDPSQGASFASWGVPQTGQWISAMGF